MILDSFKKFISNNSSVILDTRDVPSVSADIPSRYGQRLCYIDRYVDYRGNTVSFHMRTSNLDTSRLIYMCFEI